MNANGDLWAEWYDLWTDCCAIGDVTYDLWVAYPREPSVDALYEAEVAVNDLVWAVAERIWKDGEEEADGKQAQRETKDVRGQDEVPRPGGGEPGGAAAPGTGRGAG